MVIVLSQHVYGNHRFNEYLLAFHGRPLRPPQDPAYAPARSYIAWHWAEVFKGPARYIAQGKVGPEDYVAESDVPYS